ncbi:hypothetical protein ACTL32_02040 [Planococcus sp. FY231025]|uniref:hypothetical protein n=1 Tax=Planococcus sp. FY231025 TaxID=3455699 RepID=UPI003F93D937
MGKVWLLTIFIWATSFAAAFAAMDPEEIKEIKQAAPLHLRGEVSEDAFIKEIDFPGQERVMSIKVAEVLKGSELVHPGETIDVFYTYIPHWLEVEGGAKMDIAVSDKIEIWLVSEESTWKPAASGDTVTHLFKSEERPEHMVQPFTDVASGFIDEIPLLVYVILSLAATLGLVSFLSARLATHLR